MSTPMNTLIKATAVAAALCIGLAAPHPAAAQTLPATQEEICPLLINSKAPTALRQTAAAEDFDLGTLVGKKPTILVFYRGDW